MGHRAHHTWLTDTLLVGPARLSQGPGIPVGDAEPAAILSMLSPVAIQRRKGVVPLSIVALGISIQKSRAVQGVFTNEGQFK
jgi:hypothetical protein